MISVVLPTYNGARYLRESIESVLRQTTSEWELIIVDDCSTDETPMIADAYARQDARIRVIHNAENQKLPRSLNIGFAAARGEYLTWTSDDNRYLPEALEKMRAYLTVHEEMPLVSAQALAIDEAGALWSKVPFPDGRIPPLDVRSLFAVNSMGACFMYRRSVADAVGAYDPELFGVEDYDYWLRILEAYQRLGTLPEILYEYRFHAQSLTVTKNEMVLRRQYALREKHWPFLWEDLREKPQLLTQVFIEMCSVESIPQNQLAQFFSAVPGLRGLQRLDLQRKYIVYAAGVFGREFAQRHPAAVCCFADRNPALQGRRLLGHEILSLEQARQMFPAADVVIAGASPHVFSMMQTLRAHGIETYAYCRTLLLA